MSVKTMAVAPLKKLFGFGQKAPPVRRYGPATAPDFEVLQMGRAVQNWFHRSIDIPRSRLERYRLMDALDSQDIIASAHDLLAEDATRRDLVTGRVVWVVSPNRDIERILNSLLARTRQETRAFSIIRDMTARGDHFESIRQKIGAADQPVGIQDTHPVGAEFVSIRQDELQRLAGYGFGEVPPEDETAQPHAPQPMRGENDLFPWEMLHFRLLGAEMYYPYGTPFLLPATRITRMLNMSEEQMVIARLMRAPPRLKWKVWTGGVPADEINDILNMFQNRVQKKMLYDPQTGQMKHEINPIDTTCDLFIPVGPDGANSDVELLQGAGVIGNVLDIEYLRKRFFACLRIPPDYMGYEESKGTLNANTPLAEQQDRYANTVDRIQRAYMEGILMMCRIELILSGIDIWNKQNEFKVVMPPVSSLREERAAKVAKDRAEIVATLIGLGQDLGIDQAKWRQYVGKISGLPEEVSQMIANPDSEGHQQLQSILRTPTNVDKAQALLESWAQAAIRESIRHSTLSSLDESYPLEFPLPTPKLIQEATSKRKRVNLVERTEP